MGLDDLTLLISASSAAAGAAGGLLWAIYSRCYVAVPPNRALVVYGRRASRDSPDQGTTSSDVNVHRPRITVGGSVFVAPWNKGVGRLSLDPVSVDLSVRSMHSFEGARASGWEVRLQVQAKIPAEPIALARAAENLLGRTDEEVRAILRRTVEGTVPTVLSRLRAEDGVPDWDRLAAEIQASAASDLVTWGLVIQTLSVTELRRIVPSESSTSLSTSKPAANPGSPADWSQRDALLNGLDARMARAERNIGLVGATIARMFRETAAAEDRRAPVSVLDIPLGSEVPPSTVSVGAPIASPHESMEDGRPSSPDPRPLDGRRGEAEDGGRPSLD
jgi:hypothetical protein